MEKFKISGSMLDRAKKAEEILAREEAKGMGEFLPEDHPLKAEVERQKSMMGGDLSGLPPGHPLLRALEGARKQYEERKAAEAARSEAPEQAEDASGVKKAKRVDLDAAKAAARKAERFREDDELDRRRRAAAEVNKGIETVTRVAKELFELVARSEEALASDPHSRVKTARLKRMLFAAERGVAECRIVRV